MKPKKNILIIACCMLLSVALTFVVTYKFYGTIKAYKDTFISKKEINFLRKNINEIKNLDKLEDDKDAWYNSYHFVSHAGGGIDGKTYSNSLEAWNLSYEKGNRIFDADLMFTTDNKLVLRHENNDNLEFNDIKIEDSKIVITDTGNIERLIEDYPLDYDSFINSKIYNKYTSMSLEDMLKFMFEHKDVYVSIDVKNNLELAYKQLYDTAVEKNINEVLDRIIVSVYDDVSLKKAKSAYDFKNYVMRQYVNNPQNYYELAKYCIENNIHVVNITKKYITSDEIELLESKGIHVYVAVIDYISDLEFYKNKGASGAISNYLYEDDWNN